MRPVNVKLNQYRAGKMIQPDIFPLLISFRRDFTIIICPLSTPHYLTFTPSLIALQITQCPLDSFFSGYLKLNIRLYAFSLNKVAIWGEPASRGYI